MSGKNSTSIQGYFPWPTFADVYCVKKNIFVPAKKIDPSAPLPIKITAIDKKMIENLCLLALYKKSKSLEKIFFYVKTNYEYPIPSITFIDGKITYIDEQPVIKIGIIPQHKEVLEQRILPHIQSTFVRLQ